MTKTFVKSANLRSLLLKDLCPEAIANCQRHFVKFLSPDIRNGTLIDINSFLSDPENDPPASEPDRAIKITLSETTFKALRLRFPNTIPTIRRIITFHTFEGRTFTTCSRHEGNSSVLVRSSLDNSLKPARIQEILEVSSKEILYVVRHHRRVVGIPDPFAKYPFLHISLWSVTLGNCSIIRPEEVASHFASIPCSANSENNSLAVVSLYRVSEAAISP